MARLNQIIGFRTKNLLIQKLDRRLHGQLTEKDLVGEGHGEGLLHGHGQPINSPIAVQFRAYDEECRYKYKYDPEKAKEMLDELGYVDKDDDGFREDPDGNKWVLNMDYPVGNPIVKDLHH